ncbi:hypothetical protein [Variovorax sp. dw_954]|uniref:hypothetical protein n=1 Tax=Variovorax sp. dw_954 TaxID=2720078 RepID=UPI001BD5BEB2|nr:hypothetical protein [Variovorax sp. dw_954]
MKVLSNWRSVRLWESVYERDLRRRHSLRAYGILIGIVTLLLMWGVAEMVRRLGTHSLAVRYVFTLGVGYIAYLLILRWWAQRLVEGRRDADFDLPDAGGGLDTDTGYAALARADGTGLGDLPGGSLDLASAADGELIVVPVIAIFLIGIAVVLGAGWLVMLFFGSDVLLAVTLEIAFSYVAARATVRLARAGWLSAAVKLTWKPLLGAVICAVVLGAAIDVFLPAAATLPQAVRMILGR